jgi:hypothetical protein
MLVQMQQQGRAPIPDTCQELDDVYGSDLAIPLGQGSPLGVFGSGSFRPSKRDNLFHLSSILEPPKCLGTKYGDLLDFVDGGIWLLEGSKQSHENYRSVSADIKDHWHRIKLAGGVFLQHSKSHCRQRGQCNSLTLP